MHKPFIIVEYFLFAFSVIQDFFLVSSKTLKNVPDFKPLPDQFDRNHNEEIEEWLNEGKVHRNGQRLVETVRDHLAVALLLEQHNFEMSSKK